MTNEMQISTEGLKIPFGRYKGELVTRVPVGYLNWSVASGVSASIDLPHGKKIPFFRVAMAEIKRRGERIQEVDVSSHAIDRLSQKFLEHWKKNRNVDEGIFSWAQRITKSLWEEREKLNYKEEKNKVTIEWLGLDWVIQTDLSIPVLLTVK